MGRKLEWELSGKSDVPQKMAQAKASMEGLEGASTALSKKFKEAFKDIAVGFVAPMALVQKALSFMTDQFEKLRQFAQEARNFAKDADTTSISPGAREAIIQEDERRKKGEEDRKRIFGQYLGYRDFLLNDPRGRKMVEQEMPVKSGLGTKLAEMLFGRAAGLATTLASPQAEAYATGMATRPEVQAKVEAILAQEAAMRAKTTAEKEDALKGTMPKGINEIGSNVVGVGQSPQLLAMKEQTDHLANIDMSLRAIVNSGMTSSNNMTEKGQQGSQAPSGFVFGYTHILGKRFSR